MTTRLNLALYVLIFLVSGCIPLPLSWQRLTLNEAISGKDVAFIVDGATRLTDVVDRLGSPNDIQPVGELIIARYYFADGKYFQVDFGWVLRIVSPFFTPRLVSGGGGSGSDTFQLICDAQWVVKEHAFALHANSSEFRLWPFGEASR